AGKQPQQAPKSTSKEGDMDIDAEGFPVIEFPPGRVWMLGVNGRNRMGGQQVSTQNLADELTNRLGRIVTDQTGLTAKYDFLMTFSSDGLNPALRGPVGAPDPSGSTAPPEAREPLPTIFESIQSQLGLKLEPKKGAVEIIVVDHIEKAPVDN